MPSESEVRYAAQVYLPHMLRRIDFRGRAPRGSDLGCRVCCGIIMEGDRAVDTGYAPFHEECYNALMVYHAS